MYPFLLPNVFGYLAPMYDILILIGIFFMLGYVIRRFERRDGYTHAQTNRLIILLIASLLVALASSYVIDGIFHTIAEGEAAFGSISFLGGLIGGVGAFLLLLKFFYKEENKDVHKLMNTILTGVVLAHAFGRIGCFLAGCCYGVPTESFLGVVFPHGHASDVFPGEAIFPTQLFEAGFLFALFFILDNAKKLRNHEVEAYLFAYGTWRILIEFIRGDDRGVFVPLVTTQYNVFPTPSQFMSLLMIVLAVVLVVRGTKRQTAAQ